MFSIWVRARFVLEWLLLRGVVSLGEGRWAEVREQFLLSKKNHALEFRFLQMTSAPDEEQNKFQW